MKRLRILSSILMVAIWVVIPIAGLDAAERVLKVRFGSDVDNMDPSALFGIENQTMCFNIYSGLVKYDEKTNKIVPDLADRWKVSPDGKEYTFYLRKGVKWQKGFGEFTAEDVKYTYERIMKPETKSRYVGEFKIVDKIEVVDPYTVKILLKQPLAGFLHKVTAWNQGFIVNKKAIEQFGNDYPLNPVGTGPFIFDKSKWVPGSEINLIAHKDYFEGPPSVDRVFIKVIYEETAAEIALAKGEVDIFYYMSTPDVIDRLKKEKGITLLERSSNFAPSLILNSTYKPLSDKRVRQAMAYGINRKSLVQDFFQGKKGEVHMVITKNFVEYTPDIKQYPYDPDKAKKLLKEAGYPNGFPLDLIGIGLYPFDKIVIPIGDDLKKIGIDANIKVMERAAYNVARMKGDLHTCISGIAGPPDPDKPLWHLFHTSSFPPGLNTARYDKVDGLLEAAQREQDTAKRLKLYHQAQKQLAEDIPVIPLYEERLYMAHRKNVKNLILNSLTTVYFYPVKLE